MMGTWRRTLRVADFSGKGFMMSSIQLVRPSIDKSGVIIDGVKVIQSPFPTQMRSDPLYVYFQIYNLVPDADGNTSFETECILLPRDRSDLADGKVIYQKEKTGKETTSAEFYAIDIHSVDPGVYRLIVRVTDRKRVQAVSAERTLDILSP
jgi:hypothetical protein